jgi:hypothetical protein
MIALMERQQNFCNLSNYLTSALGMLELDRDSPLRKDVLSICDYLENPSFRIAVFAPFNYGKSTLLNALLGEKTLPIDLIPTTGAAIYVRYGEQLSTKITLQDGKKVTEAGTAILKEYALLDEERCMRNDVTSVEVYCPHPFLQTGVEFLDLPGTNDREAQDELVRDKLLTADLIVQVLDARKLMTLGEREHLRDWLLDRGIKTVVFVVNFLNLLEPEAQKEVYNRLRFIAENFRSQLPNNLSNLYRVDALPALRSRLKGDISAAQTTGLVAFESALGAIVQAQKEDRKISSSRLLLVIDRVEQAIAEKRQAIAAELEIEQQKNRAKLELKQKAEKLIKQAWQRSVSDFQSWLYLPNLLKRYQAELAIALQQNNFNNWQEGDFKQTVLDYQKQINEWVNKACEIFEKESPNLLKINFLESPNIPINSPPSPEDNTTKNTDQTVKNEDINIASVAIPTSIGWVLGGPVGAAVLGGASYLLNKTTTKSASKNLETETQNKVNSQTYVDAAEIYLTDFSKVAFAELDRHEKIADKVINFSSHLAESENQATNYKLQLLDNLLDNLKQELKLLQDS